MATKMGMWIISGMEKNRFWVLAWYSYGMIWYLHRGYICDKIYLYIYIERERDLINSAWTHQMLVMVLVFRTWGYKWLVIDMIDILFLDVLHNMFVRYLTWYAHPLIDRMWLLDHPQQVATMKIGYDMTMKMVTFLATNESNQWLKAKICPVVHLQNMKSLYRNVWCKFLPVFWRKIQPFWSMLIHFLGSEQYSKFDPL